jgi:hypothetical protein
MARPSVAVNWNARTHALPRSSPVDKTLIVTCFAKANGINCTLKAKRLTVETELVAEIYVQAEQLLLRYSGSPDRGYDHSLRPTFATWRKILRGGEGVTSHHASA